MQELLETKYNCYQQKGRFGHKVMQLITTTRPNSTLQNQTSADLYLWIMSSIPARTVRNEIQLLLWNKKAVLAIVKEPQLCSITTTRPNSTTKIKLVPIYTFDYEFYPCKNC